MPKSNNRSRSNHNDDWGVSELVRERPIAAAAAAAGAAAAGLFLWSRRAQISNQLSNLSDQIGDWTQNFSSDGGDQFMGGDDTAGLATTGTTSSRSTSGNRASGRRGMSTTGGGNASLGARSGGGGMGSSASGRGRARGSTPQATR